MTKDIMNDLIAKLSAESLALSQVAAYEGQFEDISEFLIVPPSAFVALDRCANDNKSALALDYSASVYLVTNYIQGADQSGMLDLIDAVVDALHGKALHGAAYSGRCFYTGFSWLGIFPGFCVYQLSFNVIH